MQVATLIRMKALGIAPGQVFWMRAGGMLRGTLIVHHTSGWPIWRDDPGIRCKGAP